MTASSDGSTEWQYIVVTFGARNRSNNVRLTELTILQIRELLTREGLPEEAVHEVESYPSLLDVVGAEVDDGPEDDTDGRYPQDVLSQAIFDFGEAYQFIIDNREWIALTMASGVVGNRTDAAVTGLFHKLRRNRTIRQLPELNRETAWASACHALRRTYSLPGSTRFVAFSEQQESDGAWSFALKCWTTTAAGDADNDGWLYSANVRPPANVGEKGKGQFNLTRVGRSRL